jgi:DNA helicase-2/ATP-dependent DNA helicase PcrA
MTNPQPEFQNILAPYPVQVREAVLKLLAGLNDEQKIAAMHNLGPIQVTAGAGAGKTRTLIQRTAILLTMGVPASDILLVTFTQKAAQEIKLRLQDQIGDNAQYITAGTFHSIIYARILKKYNDASFLKAAGYDFTLTSILDQSESDKLFKLAYSELPPDDLLACEENEWTKDIFLTEMSKFRASGMDVHDLLMQLSPKDKNYEFLRVCLSIWNSYTHKCKAANGIDFDDILVISAKLLQAQPELAKEISDAFKYIMLDEYQDTNPVQQMIMDAIASNHGNIMVVGDEKQAIYGFRNADISVMLGFSKRYHDCVLVNMNRNYRSNPLIIQWANACARSMHETQRLTDGMLKAESPRPPKKPIVIEFADQEQEAEILVKAIMRDKRSGTPGKEIAVLYRNRRVKDELERKLVELGQEYIVVGDTSFYQRAEVKDSLALLRFIFRPWDQLAGMRVLKAAKMGVSADSAKSANEAGIPIFNHLKTQSEKKLKITGKNTQGEYSSAARKVRPFLQIAEELRDSVDFGDSPEFLTEVISELWDVYLRPKISTAAKKNVDDENNDALDNKIQNVHQVFTNFRKGLEKGLTVEQVLDEFSMMSEEHPDMDRSNDHKIRLMTVHASKGLEFSNVYMMGMDNATYKEDLPFEEIEEERRNVYVGITRAQQQLVLSYCKHRVVFGKSMQLDKAIFVKEILKIVNEKPLVYSAHAAQQTLRKAV